MATKRILQASVLIACIVGMAAPARAQGGSDATVTVVHALPEFIADVYVNGDLTLSGFKPKTATDPLELAPGVYHLAIRDVGASADTDPVLAGTARFRAGQNVSIVAGLTVAGDPHLNVFMNDVSSVAAGDARIVVGNVAAAGPVDVLVNGELLLRAVANGQEQASEVAAGRGSVEITTGQGRAVLVNASDFDLPAGSVLILYVVGSQDQGVLDLMAQRIMDVPSSQPDVPSGDGGRAATPTWPAWAIVLLSTAAAGVAWSTIALARRGTART